MEVALKYWMRLGFLGSLLLVLYLLKPDFTYIHPDFKVKEMYDIR